VDLTRKSGLLLHPTALPGPYGRGDVGPAARAFVDALVEADQTVWQILPLGPAGFGGSPYAASSAFAGDPLLISPELLVEDGLLDAADLASAPAFPPERVTHEAEAWRRGLLTKAAARYFEAGDRALAAELARFREGQSYWLETYALFAALKKSYDHGAFWACWPRPLARAMPAAVREARHHLHDAIEEEVFLQFLFDRQWRRLRDYAHARGVEIFGDIPIFVARDSADTWAHPELFYLDARGEPTVVAGVPPDIFSDTGQLWGNPLYDWAVHARTGYAWWIERLRRSFEQMDLIRIDHFRGFAGSWEIPAGEETAEDGRWVDGPGMDLFTAIRDALGELPIVAEDLGFITEDVHELREKCGFPGMRIVQFAFSGDPVSSFLPENHDVDAVAYTGTHDNETTAGWWTNLDDEERARVTERLDPTDPVWGLLDLTFGSKAFLAVAPVQDVLELDNRARFNFPGKDAGNWGWRLEEGQLGPAHLRRLAELTARHGRSRRP